LLAVYTRFMPKHSNIVCDKKDIWNHPGPIIYYTHTISCQNTSPVCNRKIYNSTTIYRSSNHNL